MLTIDPAPGSHIADACAEAVSLANAKKQDVEFLFNDVKVVAHPGDTAEGLQGKWDADREAAHKALIESPEYKQREAERAEAYRARCAAVMIEKAQTEKEMREAETPWPYTEKQLLEYIRSLVDRPHDYGTCVYAMSLAALAGFYFVSHRLGVTGFQGSCADLDFIRRTRSMKGPFILLKAEDMLFPQYDLREKLEEAMEGWKAWLKEQALLKLQESPGAHPNVYRHWKKLADRE